MKKRGNFLLKFFVVKLIISIIFILAINLNNSLNTSATNVSNIKEKEITKEENLVSYKEYNDYDVLKKDSKVLVEYYKDMAKDVLKATNKYRNKENKNKLKLDDNLSRVATIRAMEIALNNKFSHKRPNGTYYSEIFEDMKIVTLTSGENIASGQLDGNEVCKAWSKSKGHYANMINESYNKLGVGIYTYNNTIYWVQIFSN